MPARTWFEGSADLERRDPEDLRIVNPGGRAVVHPDATKDFPHPEITPQRDRGRIVVRQIDREWVRAGDLAKAAAAGSPPCRGPPRAADRSSSRSGTAAASRSPGGGPFDQPQRRRAGLLDPGLKEAAPVGGEAAAVELRDRRPGDAAQVHDVGVGGGVLSPAARTSKRRCR